MVNGNSIKVKRNSKKDKGVTEKRNVVLGALEQFFFPYIYSIPWIISEPLHCAGSYSFPAWLVIE